ncbi:cell division transporter substrate-binding protein FtsY [Alkalidesulfovibrio alkalitolerans DSM 16529]|uniref:Signal recognition particle receptor FtsY n=1 Tax=Alkalidesulfovibrio alkalitolerans DSM 16529 TaxID=1121439 RepID=S7T4T2_9BACT|nr:signal recognition particle-docking protein FtsY [Alkalidesulfovibrio alkalitolerans]EPR31641.1 cell division transporter substrate-binding protein FtsY [Alkalidesulfovibrio alkalitolerans DSM 16529]
MGFFSKFKKIWDVDSRLDKAVEEFKTEQGLVDAAPPPETPPLTAVEPVAPAQKTEAHAPEKPAPGLSADQKAAVPGWQKQLLLSLRQAEPRLSVWLALILEGVEKADDKLWERLRFLFSALETKPDEAESFIASFRSWLDVMEYERVSEFRSELQYRLALALELEDEEDERSRLFLKLSEGLEKTRQTITRRIESILTSRETIDEGFWEELEEILITADVGYEPTVKLVERLRERMRAAGSNDPAAFKEAMRDELAEMFKTPRRIQAATPPEVVMMVGVNGVGKTTTIGKLAHRARMQGRKVIIAAGDTFRAAAVEQLEVWAKRVDAGFFSKGAGADPAAVAYEAIDAAIAGGYDLVLLDTAGRLHTKVNLMEELKKIKRVSGKKHEGAPHRTVLVVDATTGQNAIQQTKLFNEAVDLDEIILTKLDGTAKGGIVVALASQFGIPITFVGLGEKMEDLRPFDGKDFASALLGVQGGAPAPSET